jgi:hypothetical protein
MTPTFTPVAECSIAISSVWIEPQSLDIPAGVYSYEGENLTVPSDIASI